MRARERIDSSVIDFIREVIRQANQNEVFFSGSIDREGHVREVRIAARGNETSVPALKPYMEKSDVVIHNHPTGNLNPSEADLNIASHLGNQGIGFMIVDNSVTELYVVAEPLPLKERIALDPAKLADVLKPGGGLSRRFPAYEERRSQVELLEMVCTAFNNDTLCIAEAGTGIGKSLAYLIPAVDWVSKNEERIVVSTGTINLQQQLLEKDIPLVKEILSLNPKVVLVKGRSNYLCLRRLSEAVQELSLIEEKNEELAKIKEWALSTETGSRSDLAFQPSAGTWSEICSDADACLNLRCLHRESCFVLKNRREAASASILVVNHHLLFSDLEVRISGLGFDGTAVLPPFRRIIFDEAHNIESSATSFFSETYSRFALRKHLGRLHRKKRGRIFGALPYIERLLSKNDSESIKRVPGMIQEILDRADILDQYCLEMLKNASSLLLKDGDPDLVKSGVIVPLADLAGLILEVIHLIDRSLSHLPEDYAEDETVFECRSSLRRLGRIAEICDRFKEYTENEEKIFWLEKGRGYNGERYIRFIITPLDISDLMREAVLEPFMSVIFTSATLTVDGSFSYWESRLGLCPDVPEGSFPSPFNFKDNVLLCIPKDGPLPAEPKYAAYLADMISAVLELSEGKALVLFTSYAMLNATYEKVLTALAGMNINIFKQGQDDRNRLLVKFRSDTGSVLFATDSFWEGIDTPGEALEVLIVCRLPFKVPTEPIIRARTEAIALRGGNPFLELSLPDAVIKLRQGFGRLVRRRSDGGIVLILDSRIIKRSYGSFFLNSLPDAARCIKDGKYLFEDIEDFLGARSSKAFDT